MLSLQLRPKQCAHCGKDFQPWSTTQRVCPTARCARGWLAAQKKREREQDKAKRQSLKRISEHKADAQHWFRRYIRLRDRGLPCVSCGIENPPMKPGGQWDAGHFLGRGAYPELAFDEDNCWKQCKSCNAGGGKFKHKERTVNEKYEVELLRRIGPERLARLKGPHPVNKRTREELNALESTYKAKCKELEKQDA